MKGIISDLTKDLNDTGKEYIDLKIRYLKLEIIEKLVKFHTKLLLFIIAMTLLMVVLVLLGFVFGVWFESIEYGSQAEGMLLYMLLLIVLFAMISIFRVKLISNPLVRELRDLFF